LKISFLKQFDIEMGLHLLPALTQIDILNKIGFIFQAYPESSSSRKKELLGLAKELSQSVLQELQRVKQEVFMPLIHRPGEAQVIFGHALAKVSGERLY
jgi:hypothetical protein